MVKQLKELLKMDAVQVYQMVLDGDLKKFPDGYWQELSALKNAAKCTKYLIEDVLKLDDDALREIKLATLFRNGKLSDMVKECFGGSHYKAINNAYPFKFKEWEFSPVATGFWSDKENGAKATRWLLEEKLQLTDKQIKEQLSVKLFKDNGLRGMLVKCFNGSAFEAVKYAFPGRFNDWEFSCVPNGYWDEEENRRKAIKWLIETKLQLDDEDIKNKLNLTLFKQHGLGFVIDKYYNGSKYEALNDAYPGRFKEWELLKVVKGGWNDPQKPIEATRWLINEKLKLTREELLDQLSAKMFSKNGLGGMLQVCYGDSPIEAVMAAFPGEFLPWEFKQVPNGFWDDKENGIRATKWLINEKLHLTREEILEKVTAKFFIDHGLRGMLRICYKESPFAALEAAFPGEFYQWEFKQVPKGFWNNKENGIKATKWLLEIKLKLTREQILEQLSYNLFDANGLRGMLNTCFAGNSFDALDAAYPGKFKKSEFKML